MNHTALLAYLSELQTGTWEQFKQALKALDDGSDEMHAATQARLLSTLAHIEFSWDSHPRWAICTPTLAQLPRRDSPTAVLCGQRPQALLDALCSQSAKRRLNYSLYTQPDGPPVVEVAASSEVALGELAQSFGIAFTSHAVQQLAVCVPSLSSLIDTSQPGPCPAIPPIEYFDAQHLIWRAVDRVDRDGLYRYENFYPDYRLVCSTSCRRVTREIGIYAAVKRLLWTYDHETHQLAIPRGFLPPPLYQRTLVLCSGFLASYDVETACWIYRDVPPTVAQFLGAKLNQSLEATC